MDKIGLPLADIHLKGNVYKYKDVLQFSMDRYATLGLSDKYDGAY